MAGILVVDDDDLVRTTLRQILELAGHQVLEAANGIEALNIFDNNSEVDLVVTDIIMPQKEGIETIIDLRQRAPHLRIVAISGGGRGAEVDYLAMARKLGANDVLTKPFRRTQVLETVRAALA